ncbi:hypothetical protein KPL40_11170 [Clostridium gasigenes]|uniref:hypothetical protein n=1 Tax=Clostridium gasigenes TaxID=94869 RepID=UPI001C0DCB95|nr:hypothetical protein [Clostridium gasigenes]MBU3133011.1 hypothetical protein [Clostridium gasigenes]
MRKKIIEYIKVTQIVMWLLIIMVFIIFDKLREISIFLYIPLLLLYLVEGGIYFKNK